MLKLLSEVLGTAGTLDPDCRVFSNDILIGLSGIFLRNLSKRHLITEIVLKVIITQSLLVISLWLYLSNIVIYNNNNSKNYIIDLLVRKYNYKKLYRILYN